jgi:hypothetical protein
MIRIEETKRTLYDDYIVKVGPLSEAKAVVKKFKKLGYTFGASVQKHDCYYVAIRVVMDEGEFDYDGRSEFKLVNWGRSEVESSNEFNKMMTYEEFMKN